MRRSDSARDHALHDRMVDAQHRKAVERDVADKGLEGLLQRVEIAVKSRCSGSMLVTTAIVAGRRVKVPSLSSASTTIQSPAPSRVLVP